MKRIAAPLSIFLALAAAGTSLAQAPAQPAQPAPAMQPAQPDAAAAAVAVQPAAPGQLQAAPGFIPQPKKIEKPYTNDKCLKNCHEKPGFGVGDDAGVLRDLHVDPRDFQQSIHAQKGVECIDCHVDADPNFHPRTGYTRVDCRSCHSQKPPPGVFPPDGWKRLQAKGIKPPPKESLKGDTWVKTAHAKAWMQKHPEAPFCSGCHTAHAIRQAKDPRSSVNRANLAKTCGGCHQDQSRSYDVGGFLARFRLSGHGKGDLSNRYAVTECLSCHQGEAAHGEETVTKQACPNCHKPTKRDKAENRLVLSSLHSRPLASDQPVAWGLRGLYTLMVWGGVAVVAVFLVFMGFSTLYRSKDD